MRNEEIAKALEQEYGINKKAVSMVIEDYIQRKINHDQLNTRLIAIIKSRHRNSFSF